MSKLVVGAQLYTIREFCKTLPDLVASLKKIAAIGYRTVQVSGVGPMDRGDVGKAARDLGLTVSCTHVDWSRFVDDIDGVIAEHRAMGCVHAATGGLWKKCYEGLAGVRKFLDELGPVAERLADAGMDFSYHNHNHEFRRIEDGRTWLAAVYEDSDPAVLKAEVDVYWVQAGGADPAAWVRKLAGRQLMLHLKDMAIGQDNSQRFAEVGEGNLNWPAILAAAVESGVQYMLVEQDDCYGRDPFECLATSYRNLKAMGFE